MIKAIKYNPNQIISFVFSNIRNFLDHNSSLVQLHYIDYRIIYSLISIFIKDSSYIKQVCEDLYESVMSKDKSYYLETNLENLIYEDEKSELNSIKFSYFDDLYVNELSYLGSKEMRENFPKNFNYLNYFKEFMNFSDLDLKGINNI
jgi:hypothetical protein